MKTWPIACDPGEEAEVAEEAEVVREAGGTVVARGAAGAVTEVVEGEVVQEAEVEVEEEVEGHPEVAEGGEHGINFFSCGPLPFRYGQVKRLKLLALCNTLGTDHHCYALLGK